MLQWSIPCTDVLAASIESTHVDPGKSTVLPRWCTLTVVASHAAANELMARCAEALHTPGTLPRIARSVTLL